MNNCFPLMKTSSKRKSASCTVAHPTSPLMLLLVIICSKPLKYLILGKGKAVSRRLGDRRDRKWGLVLTEDSSLQGEDQ